MLTHPTDHARQPRIVHPAPPDLIRQAELADEELNRNPDGLLGRIGWVELIGGMVVAAGIGAMLAVGAL